VTAPFVFEVLGSQHSRENFHCGSEPLDRYLREQAKQDVRRRVTACYVAVDVETRAIAGYYTLAAGAVLLSDLQPELAKKLPRYPDVPVARLGRLAVDRLYRGRKLGAAMLWDAVSRAMRSELAVYALVVDAKDDQAAAFYKHHDFVALSEERRHFVLPLLKVPSGR
jgi:ribosomal protein S18 acetylase RimI-like enzyme